MVTIEEFEKAYQTGFPRTVRFLVSRGAPADCAREAAQAGWASGWEHLYQLREKCMLFTWINSIALNCYRRSLRKQRLLEPLADVPGPASADNVSAIDAERALNCCKSHERTLLEQTMSGYTAEDIARGQGVTSTAIRIRLLRLRRAVRRSLEDQARRRAAQVRQAA